MKIFLLVLTGAISCSLYAQKKQVDSLGQAQMYYKLGLQYKDGNGVAMDYEKAFGYFSQAAALGDAQSVYAVAYMHYKGLGTTQDYDLAATLFKQGAATGKDNSMYFYGLCLRNGYGVSKNEDSAKYWLRKSADLGYKQAVWELNMPVGENGSDSAKALVKEIKNAALSDKRVLNQYQKVENHLPPAEVVAGYYKGYIIQYDWSGNYVVSAKQLILNLEGQRDDLKGRWREEGIDSFALQAKLASDSLVFSNTHYGRKDHYSPEKAIQYNFQNARFNLVQKGDTVFLAGNVQMFSPDRKEPSKPLFVALARVNKLSSQALAGLRVSPNPFTSTLNVEFTLQAASAVEVQLLTLDGKLVYRNPSNILEAGHYLLPLQPGHIAQGPYLVKIIYANHNAVVKVVKGAVQ